MASLVPAEEEGAARGEEKEGPIPPGNSDNQPHRSKLQNIVYNICISNCSDFQVGDRINLSRDKRDKLHGLAPDEFYQDNPELSKDELAIWMLNSILNPNFTDSMKEMNIQKLESAFNRLYGTVHEGTRQTFQTIAGRPLQQFIEIHEGYFEMYKKKEQLFVKQRKLDKRMQKAVQLLVENTRSPDPNRTAKMEETPKAKTYASVVSSKKENTWKLVERKKSKHVTSADGKRVDFSKGDSSQQTMDEAEALRLLTVPPGDDLCLLESETLYTANPLRFSLDIVSMWNTPHKRCSYILLGVKPSKSLPHKVLGLTNHLSEEMWQEMFMKDFFNLKPVFTYTEVPVQGKFIGVLKVKSSAGHGSPTTTTKASTSEPLFQPEQVWFRRNGKNTICKPSDLTTGQIYKWFIGSKDRETNTGDILAEHKEEGHTSHHCLKLEPFSKGHSILVTGKIFSSTPNLKSLMNIPWLYICDFDPKSRESGMLAACEKDLKTRRTVYTTFWGASNLRVSEYATIWCFVRGIRDMPESLADGDHHSLWFRKTKKGLQKHCDSLARFVNDYSVLKVLVVWPDLDNRPHYLLKFLQLLAESVDQRPMIYLCCSRMPTSNAGKTVHDMLTSDLQIEQTVNISTEKLCHDLCKHFETDATHERAKLQLPAWCEDSVIEVNITQQDAAWFKEDLEVLYLNSPYSKSKDLDEIDTEVDKFLKGGTIHWFAWYECGAGHFDIQRDLMDTMLRKIKALCSTPCKSVMVTLMHAPGSGGTTLAQRLLWELHTTTPCVQVRTRSGTPLEQISSKIQLLYELTNLPIIILIDGEDEQSVKMLLRQIIRVSSITIYVKRYPYRITATQPQENGNKFCYWLLGEVSQNEANRLALKLKDRIEDESRKGQLDKLCRDVHEHKKHCLYEFGLTAYLHEFRGIKSYVRGYLNLSQNRTRHLLHWQTILGYLSLVYYYSQVSIPCQFFVYLLGKPPNYDVTVDDFPQCAQEFIVEDSSVGRSGHIRTSHYIIAQEILEQILTRHAQKPGRWTREENPEKFSRLAKQNLLDFVLGFIDYSRKKASKSGSVSSVVQMILARTFIFRENTEIGEETDQIRNKKKPIMSRLLTDIESAPPYTERLKVLEQLTKSFPEDPNFHAHLGRFYDCFRPEDTDKAEECFKTALQLCEQQLETQDSDEKLNLTLMHVYHMYGMIYLRRIRSLAKNRRSAGQDIPSIHEQIPTVLPHCEKACEFFGKCRKYTPSGQEQCHGYVGEISARLEFCEVIKDAAGSIKTFLDCNSSDQNAVEFILESITQVDTLIMDCCYCISPENLDRSFFDTVLLYNTLFNREAAGLDSLRFPEDNNSRRLKIVAKKLKNNSNMRFVTTLESVSKEEITEIVDLYEQNFQAVREMGEVTDRRDFEMDNKEWLFAIRHEQFKGTYTPEDVHTQVFNWHDHLKSPLSLFYLFVVTSLMGFGSKTKHSRMSSLIGANRLKEELCNRSKYMPRSRYPREWLGKGEGIRQLVSASRFPQGHIDNLSRKMQGPFRSVLAVCKGTICPNSKRFSGYISMDLTNNSVPVKVFFIPKVCKMIGQRFEGTRVEFLLAFTMDLGYEAFNVVELEKIQCRVCKTAVEITSDEDETTCPCGEVLVREESFYQPAS